MLCIWRHVRLELPDGWELLQFSKNPEQGRCAFADRTRFRLEFSWRRVPAPPELDHVLDTYAQALREQTGEPVERLRKAGWPGLEARLAEGRTSRFGRYLARERCLAEVVFLWEREREPELEAAVLGSVREEPARADGLQRWRAFGLDLLAAGGLPLAACRVEPASARFTFAGERRGDREESFQRLGLVRHWLKGSVQDWLRLQFDPASGAVSEPPVDVAGHAVLRARAERSAPGLAARLRGRRLTRHAAAWICPADGRLYAALCDVEGRAALPPPLAGTRLRCCEAMAWP
jgi:hypothetical protein